MRVGMPLSYAGGFKETAARLGEFERAGLDIAFVPEVYTFDSVSQLGFLAARTTTVELASGILNIYGSPDSSVGGSSWQ
jgi:alkanesulfonate monooxygenase SsuD/methylene tetrahydromethanopterin reductase-like flavin-dependent oxidoreductase (luciferase family)